MKRVALGLYLAVAVLALLPAAATTRLVAAARDERGSDSVEKSFSTGLAVAAGTAVGVAVMALIAKVTGVFG